MSANRSTSTRSPVIRQGAAQFLVASLALVATLLPATASATPTPTHLAGHGWSCGLTPPTVTPTRIVCGTPGTGRPFPGNPDPRPTYRLWLFTLTGELVATVRFVRADLYAGQPCNGGDTYVDRPLIGYRECINLDN